MALQTIGKWLKNNAETDSQASYYSTSLELFPHPSPTPEQIKQTLQQRLALMLRVAALVPVSEGEQAIRTHLQALQHYCTSVGKTFTVVEEAIACDQYDLGGVDSDTAALFLGPDEQATVAICVTHKGSLLHRNDSNWIIYRDAGDVGTGHLSPPQHCYSAPQPRNVTVESHTPAQRTGA